MFRIKDNEARRTRALKKAKDTQEMCKVRDKEIERQVIEIALNLMCMTFECFINRLEDRLQPNIGFTFERALTVFARSDIIPPTVNRFG